MKVGVEGGRKRDAEGIGGGQGGPAEGALGSDVDHVGSLGTPGAEQGAAGGQAQAEHGIAGDGEAGVELLGEGGRRCRGRRRASVGGLARSVDGDAKATPGKAGGELSEGHGDAVDLGWEGFGDEGEFHACEGRSSCVVGYAMAKPPGGAAYHYAVTNVSKPLRYHRAHGGG